MREVSLENLLNIVVASLNKMDKRLTGHGERVAYDMLLIDDPRFSRDDVCKLTWTVLLHDIGNFRQSDIEDLIKRENDRSFSHARYGYLFLRSFSPFPEFTPIVRYHHSGSAEIEASDMEERLKWASECLQLFDTADLFFISHPGSTAQEARLFVKGLAQDRFDPAATEAVLEVMDNLPQAQGLNMKEVHGVVLSKLKEMEVTGDEKEMLLKTIVRAIDFRSHATALHCSIVMEASGLLAEYCGLDSDNRDAVQLGAMLHDLGKIGTPTNILESSGKLEGNGWDLMKAHVTCTEEILRGRVDDEVLQIAIRHHEKLDGTGYPYGLTAEELTLPQRIVAVADIVSALCEERSYKKAFPLEKVLAILEDMASKGGICPKVVSVFREHKDTVYNAVMETAKEADAQYTRIYDEYANLASEVRYTDCLDLAPVLA